MGLASFLVELAALAAVVVIGALTLRQGERAAKAAETAAAAAARSATASEAAARVAASDARIRRLEGLMDVVLQMRELLNLQIVGVRGAYIPPTGSPEALARIALRRTLEGRLAVFGDRFEDPSNVVSLSRGYLWTTNELEGAINDLKAALTEEALE